MYEFNSIWWKMYPWCIIIIISISFQNGNNESYVKTDVRLERIQSKIKLLVIFVKSFYLVYESTFD